MTLTSLIGREPESRRIAELLDGVPERGGALLVHGAAGVGKSALLAEAAELARRRGMTVLATTGVRAEANLSFAALHHLLRPLLPLAERLPATQRTAICSAFGRGDGPAPDRFLIALAVLELLTEAAEQAPLLVIADDAQLIDQSSADVLGFVARRVRWDPIVLLGAVPEDRDCPPMSAGLDRLPLAGLGERSARQLLRDAFPELAPAVHERVMREAQGNPLALLELPAALSDSVREGEAVLPHHLPLTERLTRSFADRLAVLPPATRVLVQVAAVGDSGVLTEVLRAAKAAGGASPEMADLDPAVGLGLVHLDGPMVRFRHPLVRSAVYQDASIAERNAVHRALAETLAEGSDRRVWHRAAAVAGQDSDIAAELEAMAARAGRRGDLVIAAAGYERAAALTADRPRRGALLLSAAEAANELGRSELVRRLLREADAAELSPVDHARSLWLGDAFRGGSVRDPARVDALVDTADAVLADGGPDLALNLLMVAAMRCRFGNVTGETVRRLVASTDRTGVAPDDPRRLNILATAAPFDCGAEVLERLRSAELPDDPSLLQLLASAANNIGAFQLSATLCGTATARLRGQGRLGVLARIQASRAWAAILAGDFPEAVVSAEEGARLSTETNQPIWQLQAWTAQAALVAFRGGDAASAEELAERVENAALPWGDALNLALVQSARALTALGLGRHEEAYRHMHRIWVPEDPAHHELCAAYGIGDLAEAAVYSDHHEEARALLIRVRTLAERTPSPYLHAALGLANVLLAADEEAEAGFQRALADAELLRWPFLQARMHLVFGGWLRRQRRPVESRLPLRTARDAFDALGLTPWGERARQELRAAGETSSGRAPDTLDALTAQELQIVRLAAQGLSNREIGQRLYLSHRTVESHLYRAFPKLGITSRAQLSTVLGDPDPTDL